MTDKNKQAAEKTTTAAQTEKKDQATEKREVKTVDLRKLLDQRLEAIQRLSGLHTRLTSLQETLLKIQGFKYSSTRHNDTLRLKDGEGYNEFATSNMTYVSKVRDFLIMEIKKDIELTETELQAATL